MSAASSAYDQTPYTSNPCPQSHPDHLATLGRLFGLTPPPVESCSVLELGCALGGNLVPMALGLPDARFVGIDFSAAQVDAGRRTVQALGLGNVELRHADIADVGADWGTFDYVIAHGVYSWVPGPIQAKLLSICRQNLAPDGIAFVSYNTLPGWHARGVAREIAMYHASLFPGIPAKVREAKAFVDFVARSAAAGADPGFALTLRSELDAMRASADAYFVHEYLEHDNHPVYFHEFAAAAKRHGLQYLGEAQFSNMVTSNFPPEVAATLQAHAQDIVRTEQYIDFLRNRMFRQTLLVREGRPIRRDLDWRVLPGFRVGSAAVPEPAAPALVQGAPVSFRLPNGGSITSSNAITKAALLFLRRQWPGTVPFADLLSHAVATLCEGGARPDPGLAAQSPQLLGEDLLRCYAAGLVELRLRSPRMTLTPSARPVASPLARIQAQRAGPLTNLRHELVVVEGLDRDVLALLDGSRDRAALAAALASSAPPVAPAWTWVAQPGATPQAVAASAPGTGSLVEESLARLARLALLVE